MAIFEHRVRLLKAIFKAPTGTERSYLAGNVHAEILLVKCVAAHGRPEDKIRNNSRRYLHKHKKK